MESVVQSADFICEHEKKDQEINCRLNKCLVLYVLVLTGCKLRENELQNS